MQCVVSLGRGLRCRSRCISNLPRQSVDSRFRFDSGTGVLIGLVVASRLSLLCDR